MTKEVLDSAGIPVPAGFVVRDEESLRQALRDLKAPVAIKPLDGHHGNGVSLNIVVESEAVRAFALAREYASRVLVEEMCRGQDYRILVIGGRFVAAALRVPPFVTGDSTSTIEELIAQLNRDPRRAEGHSGSLTKIEIDDQLVENLQRQTRRSGRSRKKIGNLPPRKRESVRWRHRA